MKDYIRHLQSIPVSPSDSRDQAASEEATEDQSRQEYHDFATPELKLEDDPDGCFEDHLARLEDLCDLESEQDQYETFFPFEEEFDDANYESLMGACESIDPGRRDDEEASSSNCASTLSVREQIICTSSNSPAGHSHHAHRHHEIPRHLVHLKGFIPSIAPPTIRKKDEDQTPCTQFFSYVTPLLMNLDEIPSHPICYMDMVSKMDYISIQMENRCLKEKIKELESLVHKKGSQEKGKHEVDDLKKKLLLLEVALRNEILKRKELQKELDDSRKVLAKRTRARLKLCNNFEVIIAQKPQDVMLSFAALSINDVEMGLCPICFEHFDIESGWYMLNCGHKYHLVCLAQVMPTRARCCICNKEIHKILYEIFGMANRYPIDARLWDAQSGQPVDFTMEEDIHAIINDIEESQEQEETTQEEGIFDEVSESNNASTQESCEAQIDGEEEENDIEENAQQTNEMESDYTQEEEEDDDLTHEEHGLYVEDDSSGDSSYTSSEQDDPNDPDYVP